MRIISRYFINMRVENITGNDDSVRKTWYNQDIEFLCEGGGLYEKKNITGTCF